MKIKENCQGRLKDKIAIVTGLARVRQAGATEKAAPVLFVARGQVLARRLRPGAVHETKGIIEQEGSASAAQLMFPRVKRSKL